MHASRRGASSSLDHQSLFALGDNGQLVDAGLLPAKYGVAFIQQALVALLRSEPVLLLHLSALTKSRQRISIADRFDVRARNPALDHQTRGLRHCERVGLAP